MTQSHSKSCPIAAVLNIFGDNWTLLIIREAYYGTSRFSEFERNTGIAKNLLSARLRTLVEQGIFEKRNVGDSGTRYAYYPTEKGKSLRPVIYSMIQWANENIYGEGREPVLLFDANTGKTVDQSAMLSADGQPVSIDDIRIKAGPCATTETEERMRRLVRDKDLADA